MSSNPSALAIREQRLQQRRQNSPHVRSSTPSGNPNPLNRYGMTAEPTGSATQTITSSNTPERSDSPSSSLVLRLRGAHEPTSSPRDGEADEDEGETQQEEGQGVNKKRKTKIQWATTVIDNEGLGRKKSKVCCIYHKPRAVGESSSDESSSSSESDSDSDSGIEDGARPARKFSGSRGRRKHVQDDHSDDENDHGDCSGHHDHDHNHGAKRKAKAKTKRRPSPNAYEKMPKYDVKPLNRQPGS